MEINKIYFKWTGGLFVGFTGVRDSFRPGKVRVFSGEASARRFSKHSKLAESAIARGPLNEKGCDVSLLSPAPPETGGWTLKAFWLTVRVEMVSSWALRKEMLRTSCIFSWTLYELCETVRFRGFLQPVEQPDKNITAGFHPVICSSPDTTH